MKSALIVVAVVLCAFFIQDALAYPKDETNPPQMEPMDQAERSGSTRQKRATCDLLSGLKVNHSACAAHCIVRGNKGGYCNGKGVCVCRK